MDQQALVERAKRGDHDAFAELVRAAATRLDGAARLILRDPELARDAVQETLIRAWRDIPGLRDPGRFDAWLHRLTVNACLDLGRRRRRRVIEVELTPIDAPVISDMTNTLADREAVDAAMRHLDPGGRAIVVLHYFLGMPLTEVAATLGIPLGTVKSRLHRALGEMRIAVETEPDTRAPVTGGQVA
ncbi:MAG: RNA polymerase sigma factor [Chloroflexota bacterium]